MRIALLIDSLNSGGAQRQLAILASKLSSEHKFDVTIITYVEGNHYADLTSQSNVKVIYFKKRFKFDPILLYNIMKYVLKNDIQYVLAFLFTPSFYALACKLFLINRKIKVIVSERTFESYLNLIAKITRKLYFLADKITTNSTSQYQVLVSKFPKLKSRMHVVRNGIDLNLFKPVSTSNSFNYTAISIGRFEELKNPMLLLNVVRKLRDDYKIELKINWYGNVVDPSSDFYNNFIKCRSDWNLDNLFVLKGVSKDVENLIHQHDLLIHPSFGEGFPNTICEGLACGSIVMASNVYDHSYIIKDTINGYLFDPNDVEQLAEIIYNFYQMDNAHINRVKQEARKTAEELFSYKLMVNKYIELFTA